MSAIIVPDSDGRYLQTKPDRARFGLTSAQALLFPLILGAGLALLLATVQVALANTLGLFSVKRRTTREAVSPYVGVPRCGCAKHDC